MSLKQAGFNINYDDIHILFLALGSLGIIARRNTRASERALVEVILYQRGINDPVIYKRLTCFNTHENTFNLIAIVKLLLP